MSEASRPKPQSNTSQSLGRQNRISHSSKEDVVLLDGEMQVLLRNFAVLTAEDKSVFIMHVLHKISSEGERVNPIDM